MLAASYHARCLVCALLLAGAPLAVADEAPEGSSADAERVLPEVEVRGFGLRSWVRGLDAYQRGDFALAEQEFKVTRNVTSSAVLSSSFADSGFSGGGLTGFLNEAPLSLLGTSDEIPSSLTASSLNFDSRDQHAVVSYAVGASLIKQGKYAEAKSYFSSAVGYDPNYHDARLRLGLIALIEGDTKEAERRLKQLKRYCDALDCTGTDELSVSVQTLSAALDNARIPETPSAP